MSPTTARVLRLLALVAFGTGFATLGAHMLLIELLLETQLTYVIYGIAGAGVCAALLALISGPRPAGAKATWTAVAATALNVLLALGTYVSTTILVALPPVSFSLDVGDALPSFVEPPETLDGEPLVLERLRGERVVLLFHRGGWCPFCQAELAGLNDRYDDLAPLATVIAISGDLPDAVADYARRRELRYTLAHDERGAIAHQYGLTYDGGGDRGEVTAPAALVIDREGRLAWFHVARDARDRPDPEDLLAVLRSIP